MDYLSDDLRLDIASRLPLKTLGCLMCVSKTWQNLITTSHLHMKFDGILIREEIYGPSLWNPVTFFRSDLRLRLPGKFDTAIWLDYCNGLLLLWQRGPSKCYAVVNPLTKQYSLIDKPTSRSRDKDYAVLAYDPNESKYFKIVRFETSRHLKVFHSETGRWYTLFYQLHDTVTKANWVRQCVYFEGALYRLSNSGHLFKFEINKESKRKTSCAMTIDLPDEIGRSKKVQGCVGVLNGKLSFGVFDKLSLKIWELKHKDWSLNYEIVRSFSTDRLFQSRTSMEKRIIAFHLFLNVVFPSYRDLTDEIDGFRLDDMSTFKGKQISISSTGFKNPIYFYTALLSGSRFACTKLVNSKGDCRNTLSK